MSPPLPPLPPPPRPDRQEGGAEAAEQSLLQQLLVALNNNNNSFVGTLSPLVAAVLGAMAASGGQQGNLLSLLQPGAQQQLALLQQRPPQEALLAMLQHQQQQAAQPNLRDPENNIQRQPPTIASLVATELPAALATAEATTTARDFAPPAATAAMHQQQPVLRAELDAAQNMIRMMAAAQPAADDDNPAPAQNDDGSSSTRAERDLGAAADAQRVGYSVAGLLSATTAAPPRPPSEMTRNTGGARDVAQKSKAPGAKKIIPKEAGTDGKLQPGSTALLSFFRTRPATNTEEHLKPNSDRRPPKKRKKSSYKRKAPSITKEKPSAGGGGGGGKKRPPNSGSTIVTGGTSTSCTATTSASTLSRPSNYRQGGGGGGGYCNDKESREAAEKIAFINRNWRREERYSALLHVAVQCQADLQLIRALIAVDPHALTRLDGRLKETPLAVYLKSGKALRERTDPELTTAMRKLKRSSSRGGRKKRHHKSSRKMSGHDQQSQQQQQLQPSNAALQHQSELQQQQEEAYFKILSQDPESATLTDYRGNTPLHVAAAHGIYNLKLLRNLIDLYPKALLLPNMQGKTPLALCQERTCMYNLAQQEGGYGASSVIVAAYMASATNRQIGKH